VPSGALIGNNTTYEFGDSSKNEEKNENNPTMLLTSINVVNDTD